MLNSNLDENNKWRELPNFVLLLVLILHRTIKEIQNFKGKMVLY